jgi:DMSO/TMAO reductase YedYZ molybdopterin-dependent catalytic subunit
MPHQMHARATPTADMIVLCHLGVARLERETWSLTVDGLVRRSLRLQFADLLAYPKHVVTSFHQCAGSPLAPREPTRRICNVRWGGARFADILRNCEPLPNARFVWSYGADYGSFGGLKHDAYVKDLPLARAACDVLIAYELNGAPLPPEHGFPARLVVPGFYGTNSVKWLTRITLAETRAGGAFTTRWYNDPVADDEGSAEGANTVPVWSVAPESVIVAPAPGESIARDKSIEIWGWAWADAGIERVEVSTDSGANWSLAELEAREERAWQRFTLTWRPAEPGPISFACRATSRDGTTQPMSGRRNAIQRVGIRVL